MMITVVKRMITGAILAALEILGEEKLQRRTIRALGQVHILEIKPERHQNVGYVEKQVGNNQMLT